MQEVKTKIATGATVAVLAGLTGVAMSSDGEGSGAANADQQATPPKVVRRTIHVTKRADAATAAPVGTAPLASVATSSSGSHASAPSSTGASPAVTRSSGSGSGGGDFDDDHGDDFEDRIDDREDAREDREDAREDYEEDLADDSGGDDD